jgi:predicted metallo-beta-lactamase superfamily hydrolase
MRAREFIRRIKPVAKKVEIADGNELRLRGTEVKFSSPLPHGTDTRLGYIIMVNINERGERFLHTSDVEGPSLPEQERMICEYHPDILLCDGPMTHMLGNQYPESALRSSETNLVNIVTECGTETLILDHHFLRDIEWRKRMPELFKICETRGTGVMTAAEFAGEKNNLLEANRAQLYARYPVSREATFKNPHDQQDGE